MVSMEQWFKENLGEEQGYYDSSGWKYAFEGPVQPWKIHVYADSTEDWMAVGEMILPYLQNNRIYHKTVSNWGGLEKIMLNPAQRGKLYTVYSTTVEALKQIILDLDQLLLGTSQASYAIWGDQPIGKSGRLFYRYDNDLEGNYRPNDGFYKPEGVEDPLEGFNP